MIKTFLPLLVGLPCVLAIAGGHCPPTGPVLPPPEIPAKVVIPKLNSQLDSFVHNASKTFNTTVHSFSVAITSNNATFYQYHHTAPIRDPSGVKKVDGDTVYRVCSVTKTFNVLTLMLHAGHLLDTSVTKYVPELVGNQMYEDITLRMLSSQLSGVPRDGYAFDLTQGDEKGWEDAGFPVPDKKDLPPCDAVGLKTCSRAQFFDNIKRNGLMWLPGDKIAYSDQAYILLGMVMQNITGKPFAQLLRDSITGPLGMSVTGFNPPDNSRGIIPVGAGKVFWALNMGNFNETAGLFSTPNELTTYVRGILNHKLLSAANTRQWMRPAGFAGSYSMFVGAPWEIFRVSNLTPDNRPIDLYTKSGSMPGWAAYVFFIPDYNIGGSVNVAGDAADPASLALLDAIATTVVPVIDTLARQQAKSAYAGRYATSCNGAKCTDRTNASLELAIDQGAGLKIKSWSNNGRSIVKAFADRRGVTPADLDLRLYPIGENNRWRLSTETLKQRPDVIRKPSEACFNWFSTDTKRWATLPVDEFDFEVKGGRVTGVKNLGLRANLTKSS